MSVAGRVRAALSLGALLLVVGTGLRAGLLAEAVAPEGLVVVPGVRFGGPLAVALEPGGVRMGAGDDTQTLRFGERFVRGNATIAVSPAPAPEVEVLRRPFAVYAHPTHGFTRLDVGPDPRGRRDGVRDRVVVPALGRDSGWFSLRPPRSEPGARFLPDDRSALLLAERDDLIVRQGGAMTQPAVGAPLAVGSAFSVEVEGGGFVLSVRWEDVVVAEPILGVNGRPEGSRDARRVDLVFTTRSTDDASAGALLTVAGGEEGAVHTLRVPSGGRRHLIGAHDRLTPGRGSVLPGVAPHHQLETVVARGLSEGWIAIDRASVVVTVPPDATGEEPRSDLGWPLARAVVGLLDDYARGRAPLAVRLGPGLHATRARCTTRDGQSVSLRRDEATNSWVPGDRPRGGEGRVVCRLPSDGVATWMETAVAARWRPDERAPWTDLPAGAGTFVRHALPQSAAVIVELEAASAPDPTEELAVAIAGGPPDARLHRVEFGVRAAAEWDRVAGDDVASRAYARMDGDGWSASAPAPTARRDVAQPIFMRVSVVAPGSGWLALDVTAPGLWRRATWNGAPLVGPGAPLTAPPADPQGRRRLSLPLVAGRNLLALHVERPPTAPSIEGGGARFAADAEGRLVGLAAHVVDRRARPAVRGDQGTGLVDRDGQDAPALLVEVGVPGLPSGTRWWLAPGAGQPGRVALFRAREAGSGACLDPRGETHGVALALQPSGVTCGQVQADGAPLVAATVDAAGEVTLHAGEPLTLWTAAGDPLDLPPGGALLWPEGARLGLPGSALRLRRPFATEEAALRVPPPFVAGPESAVLALDDDLSASAIVALRSHLALRVPRGDDTDPHPLRGALLAMDAQTGEILACATVARAGVPEGSVADACWRDLDLAPGSTFKLATASAALRLHDPEIDAMLAGSLPAGLRHAAASGALDAARLPPLPLGGGPDRPLTTRLRNFRGQGMAVDLDLQGALVTSSNTWFGYLGLLLHRPLREGYVGAALVDSDARDRAWPVHPVARAAGFGRDLDLGLGVRGTGGRLPALAEDSDALIAARSVGQGDVRATPLGIALLLAAIATDGAVPAPTLARRAPGAACARVPLLSTEEAATLRMALALVVREGTAAAAFADHPDRAAILGKTGSAQRIDALGLPRTDSWFAGAVLPPHGDAPVVVVAVLPGAGLGGQHAAEVVDQFSRALIAARGWSPSRPLAAR